MVRRTAILSFAAGLAVVSSVGLTGCRQPEPTTAQVVRRDIVGYEAAAGETQLPPHAQAAITPPYRAPVDKVMTTVGANVKQGEVLIQLSFPTVEAAAEQARLQVKSAEASLERARAEYGGAVRAAQNELQQAREREKLARAMAQEGAADDLAAATAQRQAAEERLRIAQADLKANLAPYEWQVEQARASFREVQAGQKMGSIRAPIAGTVLELNARPGEEVGHDAQQVIVRIVNLDAIRVHAPITAEQSNYIQAETPVVVTFRGIENERFEGEVESITTVPEETSNGQARLRYIAVITFQNRDGLVKPDSEVASVAFQTGEVKDVLAIPAEAVTRDDTGRTVVRVLRNDEWQVAVVEVGLTDGNFTEIRSGLQEGDTVQVPAARRR
jgi:membrane fusion protein, macrolide-specific efflux system